jgi:hypothetical protein
MGDQDHPVTADPSGAFPSAAAAVVLVAGESAKIRADPG